MKITVIKSNVDAANMEEYFVTHDGYFSFIFNYEKKKNLTHLFF